MAQDGDAGRDYLIFSLHGAADMEGDVRGDRDRHKRGFDLTHHQHLAGGAEREVLVLIGTCRKSAGRE